MGEGGEAGGKDLTDGSGSQREGGLGRTLASACGGRPIASVPGPAMRQAGPWRAGGPCGCVAAVAANGSLRPRLFTPVGGVAPGGKGRPS